MSQNKWPLSSFLLPSTLPLPLSSTYEFSFTWTKIRPLSKGQSDELKEKDTLPDLCPLGYKYSEQALGEILCLHRQTPGSTFPPPSSSHPLCYSRTRVREKQASPCYQLHDLSAEGICFATGDSRYAGLPRDKRTLSQFNHQQG